MTLSKSPIVAPDSAQILVKNCVARAWHSKKRRRKGSGLVGVGQTPESMEKWLERRERTVVETAERGQRRSAGRERVSRRDCRGEGISLCNVIESRERELTAPNSFVGSPANLASAFNPNTPVLSNSC